MNTQELRTESGASNGALAVSASELIRNPVMMNQFNAIATVMAAGKVTVPKHLQQSQGDCFAIVMQAAQWGMNPFSVAQKTYLVNGVLGYEAQLVNAVIQSSGAIQGRFHYEYIGEGEHVACRVGATIRGESEIVWSEWLEKSKVATQNSPLWKSNPKQQLGYLQVKNWARLYCPGAILGVYSEDELQEVVTEKVINPVEQHAKPTVPICSDDKFDDNYEKWREIIETGNKTPEMLIATLKTKCIFTEEQKNTIFSWKKRAIEGELA